MSFLPQQGDRLVHEDGTPASLTSGTRVIFHRNEGSISFVGPGHRRLFFAKGCGPDTKMIIADKGLAPFDPDGIMRVLVAIVGLNYIAYRIEENLEVYELI